MRSLEALLADLSHQYEDPFATGLWGELDRALTLLVRAGPDLLPPHALRQELAHLNRMQRRFEAATARWVAELERAERLQPAPPGERCADFLRESLHVTPGAAEGQVRTARRLGELPATATAFDRGEISAAHASVICQAVEQFRAGQLASEQSEAEAEVERALLDGAAQMDPKELLRHWRQLRHQLDPQGEQEQENQERRRRWLDVRERWDGSGDVEGRLDAEGTAVLKTALHGLLGPRPAGDDRSPGQRRADALVELARWRLDAGDLPDRGGQRPHVVVVASLDTLRLEAGTPAAALDWNLPVAAETARRLACDGTVTPVVRGADGNPLYVGRASRTVPAPLRKALNLRDGHCQYPGCTMPAEHCQPHHLTHWVDGGPTDLDNTVLLCTVWHHPLVHELGYRTLRGPDGKVRFIPPNGRSP